MSESMVMHSFHHSQSHSASLERASSAQDKAMLQRQYRAKESHALAQLQKLLHDISPSADTYLTRLGTIVQATEMIKFLHYRNTMLENSMNRHIRNQAMVPQPRSTVIWSNTHWLNGDGAMTMWMKDTNTRMARGTQVVRHL
ncbi:hypothetical protein BDR06DRAFT_953450 [Suillus hirtellus]|nr:hypothetical protein BDR06DRAFT_953450 [Suillus hirtellus]